jgi:transposase
MFPAVVTVRSGNNTYQYLRILESYREDGVPKHRVVANLGRVDQLEGKLESLVQSLSRHCREPLVAPSAVTAQTALPWGPVLLARQLYDELQLGAILRRYCSSARREFDVGETAFVLIANRLTDPRSEHALARWLENYYVCDSSGARWEAAWLPENDITRQQRVRVHWRQLNLWYRTLDALLAGKQDIETALDLRVRDLFNLQVDMVLYDVTSTYFARRSPTGKLRRHGKSRDGRPRHVQVLLGVVMANGFPIAHHMFAGNTADRATLQAVVKDLEQRLGLRRVLIVGDRGMVSEPNLQFLTQADRQVRYLVGLPGRRCQESAQVLERLQDEGWEVVDACNRVQQVASPGSELQYFVVESAERKAYEQEQRERSMERTAEALHRVERAVQAGRLKDPAKIGARAQRAVSRHHGTRYYSYEIAGPGAFRFHVDPVKLAAERRREGLYILKTNDLTLTPTQSVVLYKQLSDVEWAYRDLKDVIRMRPIYHRRDDRVQAHVFVATVALFLKRTLEEHLRQQNVALSPTEAFAAMHSVGISVLDFDGETKHLVSGGGRDARRVMQAVGITTMAPPGAPEQKLESLQPAV